MNVARKSTAKLPQNWHTVQKLPSKEDDGDSGVASTDSTDSFQDALQNLKALRGGSDVTDCVQTTCAGEKNEKKKNLAALPSEINGEEKKILEQIDDIVNDKMSTEKPVGVLSDSKDKDRDAGQSDPGNTDNLVINKGGLDGADKESTLVLKKSVNSAGGDTKKLNSFDSKNKPVPGTGPKSQRIGEKVRSTFHNIMSKFVQSNPDVNNLLNKTKSEDSVDSGGSGRSSPLTLTMHHDKRNLFDNFDFSGRDSKLQSGADRDTLSPQNVSASSNDTGEKPERDSLTNDLECRVKEECCTKEKDTDGDNYSAVRSSSENNIRASLESNDVKPGDLEALSVDDSNVKEVKCETDNPAACPHNAASFDGETGEAESVRTQSAASGSTAKSASAGLKARRASAEASGSASPETIIKSASTGDLAKSVPGVTAKMAVGESVTESSSTRATHEKKKDASQEKLNDGDITAIHAGVKNSAEPMETTETGQNSVSFPKEASDGLSHTNLNEERKRQHDRTTESDIDDNNIDSQPPKRSRLDEVIGKLGERVPFPADVAENDSFDYGDSPPGSGEKQSGEVSGSASDEEEVSLADSKSKVVKITKQELEVMIVSAAKAAIECYESTEILALNRRIEELKESQEEWREKAKNLERQVLDLTVLQQRLEKRKAHTAALKSITTRSIGVGVTEDKLKSSTPLKHPGNRTPPSATPATPPATTVSALIWSSTSISSTATISQPNGRLATSTPSSLASSPSSISSRNTSVAHLLSQTARMPTAASCAAATRATPPRLATTSPRAPASVTALTLGQMAATATGPANKGPGSVAGTSLVLVNSGPTSKMVPMTQMMAAPVGAPASQVKIIDLTMEDDTGGPKQPGKQVVGPGPVRNLVPQQIVRQIPPPSQGMAGVPSSAILLSAPAGQVVNTASLHAQRPGMLQVVTIANASSLRPGSLVTMMPGQPGTMVRQPSSATTLTTTTRETAPRLVSQQLPGMALVRPPPSNGRPAGTSFTGTTITSARMPVTLATLSQTSVSTAGPVLQNNTATPQPAGKSSSHPAALPSNICPRNVPTDAKPPPPRPGLKISRVKQGIVLSWNMSLPADCVEIASYQLFAYQETNNTLPQTSLWKKVGDVKALPLPMACTLTQFQDGNKYHFAVRAIDVHGRSGTFSEPSFIYLTKAA